MAYRLLVHLGTRLLRFPLDTGEQVLGADPDCAMVVRHPTVSRRHARFEAVDNGVLVTDLESSNGTRVGDQRLASDAVLLRPGTELRLGSVLAELEEVGAGDLETGVGFSATTGRKAAQSLDAESSMSTIGPDALELFTLKQLPELIAALDRGDSRAEVAHLVGKTLLQTMNCHRVEILDPGHGTEGIVFTGAREVGVTSVPVTADAGDDWILRVGFISARMARYYEPLVQAVAGMVRAAGRQSAEAAGGICSDVEPPGPPRPPSLVPAVREVYTQAARVARGRVSVLICGESGTGKELLARYIHAASDRAGSPLLTLNCAALPRDLLESELFGVERGVATGVEARPGKFEAAHGGTLFLDEIGDMALETQSKILRVLQEGEVFRLGGQSARPADVRVISATNRNIDAMLEDGGFRRDLYHRIADWVVELPPLRQRRADIPNLAAHFLAHACKEHGIKAAGISRSAVEALQSFDWPGNVRQLEKEMSRAALFLADGELLDTSRLQPVIVKAAETGSQSGDALKDVLERTERDHIQRILQECDGSVTAAAERLEMGVSTLYRRMKALGLD
jgi:hypothetical protein